MAIRILCNKRYLIKVYLSVRLLKMKIMLKKLTYLILLLAFKTGSYSQISPFQVYLEPISISELSGLQSYAWGQHHGKWLIVGGRLDGLHRRQPFASFDLAGNNNQLWVIDPEARKKWTAPLTALSASLQEQLSSTNMEFHQEGEYLYIIGGYGYNTSSASRITFPYLTAINVPAVIDAVINSTPLQSYFRQLSDERFAVTGGHLKKINNSYYLACGNRFDGNYNPMGNPTFTQAYTNAVRKFNLNDNGTTLTITHLPALTDSLHLHRRDYNAVPQILPNSNEGIAIFSGVFQPTIDLPFLTSVVVDSIGYTINNDFQQHYNHYHCPVLPVYSSSANQMHTIFFGGIAQFYDSMGILVQDNNVPFVKTIARVTRNANGQTTEYRMPVEMPAFLGAGAEFISNIAVPHYTNEVLKLDSFTSDTTLAGYIFGGISSSAKNIFFINTGTQSSASAQLFKVYLIKNKTNSIDDLNKSSNSRLKIQTFPNPNNGNFAIRFHIAKPGPVKISIQGMDGKTIDEHLILNPVAGENMYQPKIEIPYSNGTYILNIETPYEKVIQKIILEP